ncbi:MAG: aromatic ring-hydroxylating dioxygenase subunit alpha [Pseudomonadota bacterium]
MTRLDVQPTGEQKAQPVRSLEGRFYTDPTIYARECQTTLATTWQFACHASDVAEPGAYARFRIADEDLFVIRGRDGALRAFYNVCQHRAHQLICEDRGTCGLLVCPYHAWSYELDGRLRSGPNISAVEGFERSDIRLAEVRVENFCGFIFANLDPDAAPMAAWYPGVEDELRAFVPDIDRLRPQEWVEIPERCNWKASVENYSECYHCSLNHPTFSKGVVKPETYDIRPQGHCLRHTTECQNLAAMSYPIDLAANDHAGSYSSWFLWPAFSFQVYPGNVLNTYHWRPHAADQVTVWRGWYTVDGEENPIIRALAVQDRETTVEEDIHLVESVQRGLGSRGYRPGPLVVDPRRGVNSEHSILTLQGWIRAGLGE